MQDRPQDRAMDRQDRPTTKKEKDKQDSRQDRPSQDRPEQRGQTTQPSALKVNSQTTRPDPAADQPRPDTDHPGQTIQTRPRPDPDPVSPGQGHGGGGRPRGARCDFRLGTKRPATRRVGIETADIVPSKRSKVRIRSAARPVAHRCIQLGSGGFVQSRLALRVSVCDGHRHIDARRVRQCCRVNPDQGALGESGWTRHIDVAPGPRLLTPLHSEGVIRQGNRQAGRQLAAA